MQEEYESNAKYVQNLTSIVDAISHIGGSVFEDKDLMDYECKQDQDNLLEGNRSEDQLKKDVKEMMSGLMLLNRAIR